MGTTRTTRPRAAALAACLAFGASIAGATNAAAATCAPSAGGGHWPSAGHDLSNTRDQSLEHGLTPARAARLRLLWKFYDGHPSGDFAGTLGDFNGTPVEAGGCVYAGSGDATPAGYQLYALNADSGALVWRARLPFNGYAGLGGVVPGSPVVSGNTVYAIVNERGDGKRAGPYVAALDRRTGAVRWRSRPMVTTVADYSNASPIVADGLVVAGFSAEEGDPFGHGGFALLDARAGRVLRVTYTIDPALWGTKDAPHFAGGGIWTQPAADPHARFAYFGSGNPYSKKTVSPRADSLLKVDLDRHHRSFGRIVAYYQGDIEQYSDLLKQISAPTCALLPDDPLREIPAQVQQLDQFQGLLGNSVGCLQLDLDFGAGANLFRDPRGRLIVGDLQKSGVYHALYASTMKRAWTAEAGGSCEVCNASSPAYDRAQRRLLIAASPGSFMRSLASADGRAGWISQPLLDGFHYEGVALAAGVVWTQDLNGFLWGFDARSGGLLVRRSLAGDQGMDAFDYSASGSPSVARHTLFVESGSHVLAFRAG